MIVGLATPPGLIVGAVSGLVATTFTNTISAGVVALMAITGLGTIIGIVYGVKWKTAHAVAKALNDALEARANLLTDEKADLAEKLDASTATLTKANQTIARLEALPNLERVLELVSKTFERFGSRFDAIEQKSDALLAELRKRHAA